MYVTQQALDKIFMGSFQGLYGNTSHSMQAGVMGRTASFSGQYASGRRRVETIVPSQLGSTSQTGQPSLSQSQLTARNHLLHMAHHPKGSQSQDGACLQLSALP